MLARTTSRALSKAQATNVFRFRGCLNAKKDVARNIVRHATTSALPTSADDSALIPFFDDPLAHRSWSSSSSGLFLHESLTKPRSLSLLAHGTLRRAQLLTDRILRAKESRDELLLVLKNLDKLSDLLCGVIDLAELIRNSHPDSQWVNSANDAYDTLCEFMNVLNTHVGLYEVSVINPPALHCWSYSRGRS